MANARPPSTSASGTPQARIGIDLTAMRAAVGVARESGRQAAREISQAFRTVQNEQRLALEQARQTTVALRAQQTQISAVARAESQVRVQQARAESVAQQQAARAAASVAIEQERRKTAAFNAAARERQRAQAQSGGLGQFAGAALGGIGGPAGAVLGGIAGGSPAIAGGLALSAGVRAAFDATQLAVAYDRQRIAAINLAGSQQRLNGLLAAYDRAAGGGISRTEALSNVTKLMSVGFADSTEEITQFTRAIRGISIALGASQDTVTQNLILELFSQRGMRLDQLGLQYDKVRQRADELRVADSNLTQQQAYQNAVLEQAEERYGKLADSAEGQRSGAERLADTWENLRLEMGKELKPDVDQATNDLNDFLNLLIKIRQEHRQFQQDATSSRARQEGRVDPFGSSYSRTSIGRVTPQPFGSGGGAAFDPDQVNALRRRDEGFADIERQSTRARLDETRAYGRQVENIERSYQKTVLREAEDFARQRANAERKLNLAILDVAEQSARQRVQWEAETERQIAEARSKTADRIADIEEKYNRDQERRAAQHRDNLIDAAGRLDAKAVAEEQRNFARASQDAKQARDEQIADARDALNEQITEQRAALQRRIDEQAANDAQRIEDMKAAFALQTAQEDAERAIRLQRQAEDHDDQLVELARQHADRIQQIKDQAADERAQFTEQSNIFLEEVGVHNQAWLDEQKRINDGVLQRHTELLNAQRQALLTPGHPSLADPYDARQTPFPYVPPVAPSANSGGVNNSRTSSVTISEGAIQILPAYGQSPTDIAGAVRDALGRILQDIIN